MDIKQAAEALGCSTKTLRRYIKRGLIEARKGKGQTGQAWNISPASLEDFKRKLQSGLVFPAIENMDKDGHPGTSIAKVDTSGTMDSPSFPACPTSLPPRARADWGRCLDSLPDILNVKEVAVFLGVGVSTVRELIKSGKLKSSRLGRGFKISKKALQNFSSKI